MEQGLSIVIPVYNSEGSLPLVLAALDKVLPSLAPLHEIILINDGSRDGSWSVIQAAAAANPRVHGVNMMRNFGQHNALLYGIRAARYDRVVTLDDDLQNPPEEIPRLLEALTPDRDVVYGYPRQQEHGVLRDLASRITKLVLQKAMGAETAGHISAFRVFRTRLRDAFVQYRGSFVNLDVLLTWGSHRFAAVEVRHEPRTIGASNYTLGRLFKHAFNMLTGFSVVPLQAAGWIGLLFAVFGFCILVFVLGRYFISGSTTPGFPFLASIIAIFSGVQLCALGIMGEYLARMHDRMVDRPTYVIRDELNGNPPHA
jgi:undecaprenyl-phosphate 4-deoxy-4-formamido-L-arabinose transferase